MAYDSTGASVWNEYTDPRAPPQSVSGLHGSEPETRVPVRYLALIEYENNIHTVNCFFVDVGNSSVVACIDEDTNMMKGIAGFVWFCQTGITMEGVPLPKQCL